MSSTFHFDNFKYCPVRGLSRGGVHIHLAKRTELILQCLLENRGSIVTHEKLVAVCGGKATRVSISQAISQLRSAMGDTDGDLIKAVYGQGFRFTSHVSLRDDIQRRQEQGSESASGVAAARDDAAQSRRAEVPAGGAVYQSAACDDLIRTAFELLAQRTDERLRLALGVLDKAFGLCPSHAIIPSMQADIELSRMMRGYVRGQAHAPRVSALLEKALAIQPNLGSALASKGWLTGVVHGNIPEGLRMIDESLGGSQPTWMVPFYKAWLLIGQGELDAGLEELDRGLLINPMERGIIGLKGWLLLAQGRLEETDAFLLHYKRLRPEIDNLHILQSMLLLKRGNLPEAQEAMRQALQFNEADPFVQGFHAWFMAVTGNQKEARQFLSRARKPEFGYMSPAQLAVIYWALGDRTGYETQMKIARIDCDPWRLLSWIDPRLTFTSRNAT